MGQCLIGTQVNKNHSNMQVPGYNRPLWAVSAYSDNEKG
jgi:hypothetical protein